MFDLRKFLEDSLVNVNPFGIGTDIRKRRETERVKQQAIPASTAQKSAPQSNFFADTATNLGNFGRTIGAGIQQGAGTLGDVALQGGALIGNLGAQTNPFVNQQQRDRNAAQQLANTEKFRQGLRSFKDIENKNIVGTSDVDQNATNIAQGRGNAQDYAAVLGKGLEAANTATMFANPLSLARGASARQVAGTAAKDAALFGTTGGLQGGLQSYGQDANLGKALQQGGTSALISGGTAGLLDVAVPVAGAITRGVVNNAKPVAQATSRLVQESTPTAIARKTVSQDPRVTGYDDQYQLLAQQFDTLPPTSPQRQAVSQAMAANRQERLATSNSLERNILQGGYARVPGSYINASDALEPTPQRISQTDLPQPVQSRTIAQEQVPTPTSNLVQRVDNNSYGNGTTNPQIGQVLPDNNPRSRFASQTAPNSGNLSPELAQAVRENASSYSKSTNKESVEKSINFLSNKTEDEAITDVLSRLSQKNIDRQSVTDAIAVAASLDARGGARNLELAQNIYDTLSEQLTKAGQTVQAASIISRRTPEGMAYNATRELQRAGVNVTPEVRQAILNKTQEIGQLKLGSEARERATAELQKEVNKLIPTEFVDKLVGTWKAGLLTGIRTTTGGSLSNALFRVLRDVSRPGAVATDMLTSIITGKRSTALTGKGVWKGTTEGLKKAGKYLKSGVDERSFSADGKYIDREINFKNKALGTYVNGVFRVMGAADRPFYYSQYRNSLAEAAIVEAKNLKLKGKDFDNYVENGIKNPTDEAAQFATNVAEQAVLANDTLLSDVANKLRTAVSKQENGAIRFGGKLALGVLAPFTKVPSAFLTRVVDFTPIGAVKEAVTQMATGKLNQQKLVQAISEAGTGTGLIYLGAELANNDLLTGNYPNDPKEQARWRTEGITPNSIKIGDTYYSLNYAGPLGALFGIGKSINDTVKEGGDALSALSSGAAQLASGTLEQSFLSGISGALDAVQDPKRYAENFVRSQAGSVIPTLLNDIGNATDSKQRQANTPLEAIQGRLPGARTGLNPKLDSFGNDIEQQNPNVVGRLIDPLRPSKERSTPVTQELDRLAKAGESIFPSNDKTLKAGGKTIKLDGDQQYDYNSAVGKETEFIWENILNNDTYKGLSDSDKKKTLENASGDLNNVMKKAYLYSIGEDEAADAIEITKRQEKYIAGSIDPLQWIPKNSEAGKELTAKEKEEKAKTKVSKAKKATTKKASRARKGKYDYTNLLAKNVSAAKSNQDAVRKLVYGSTINRKKIG